jgi:hypothetical protein
LANSLIASNTPAGGDSFAEPKIAPLADNGGFTLTIALLSGSPAIDAADSAFVTTTDQRGFPRPAGLASDLGAFEYGSVMPVLSFSRAGGQGFNLVASGNTGQVCRLLASPDLSKWTPIATNQFGSDGSLVFPIDPGAATRQFYRLVMP